MTDKMASEGYVQRSFQNSLLWVKQKYREMPGTGPRVF